MFSPVGEPEAEKLCELGFEYFDSTFGYDNRSCAHDVVSADLVGAEDSVVGQVTAAAVDVGVVLGGDEEDFAFGSAHVGEELYVVLRLGGIELKVFHQFDGTRAGLYREGGSTGSLSYFVVQLYTVVAGTGAEDATTTTEDRALDVALTGATSTFLLMQFAGRTGDFAALLSFVRTLALGGQVRLYREVNGVFVGLYTEDVFGQFHFTTRTGTCCAVNLEFHFV